MTDAAKVDESQEDSLYKNESPFRNISDEVQDLLFELISRHVDRSSTDRRDKTTFKQSIENFVHGCRIAVERCKRMTVLNSIDSRSSQKHILVEKSQDLLTYLFEILSKEAVSKEKEVPISYVSICRNP